MHIHNHPHGNLKEHPFGEKGEHAHYYVYEAGLDTIKDRKPTEIKMKDREANRAILE